MGIRPVDAWLAPAASNAEFKRFNQAANHIEDSRLDGKEGVQAPFALCFRELQLLPVFRAAGRGSREARLVRMVPMLWERLPDVGERFRSRRQRSAERTSRKRLSMATAGCAGRTAAAESLGRRRDGGWEPESAPHEAPVAFDVYGASPPRNQTR